MLLTVIRNFLRVVPRRQKNIRCYFLDCIKPRWQETHECRAEGMAAITALTHYSGLKFSELKLHWENKPSFCFKLLSEHHQEKTTSLRRRLQASRRQGRACWQIEEECPPNLHQRSIWLIPMQPVPKHIQWQEDTEKLAIWRWRSKGPETGTLGSTDLIEGEKSFPVYWV